MTDTNEALETVREALREFHRGAGYPEHYYDEDLRNALAALSQIEARLGELEKEQRALRDWYDESPMKEWPDD
jgi:hypothetical protein